MRLPLDIPAQLMKAFGLYEVPAYDMYKAKIIKQRRLNDNSKIYFLHHTNTASANTTPTLLATYTY